MVSFGHGLFYGLGAYAFALLMQRTDLTLGAAVMVTMAVSATTALVVGGICIRLRAIDKGSIVYRDDIAGLRANADIRSRYLAI